LRRLKDALDVPLNDVVLTALTAPCAATTSTGGCTWTACSAWLPMSLRDASDHAVLGNRVGYFNVTLPIGEHEPLERLERIREQSASAQA